MDRDGTLSEEVGYVNHLSRFRLFPFAVDAIRLVNRSPLLAVLVTNQAGVARGFFDEAFVREAHRYLASLLASEGIVLDGYYYCPHHPEGVVPAYARACRCRKPGPGMVEQAARDLDLAVGGSFVVGDKWLDIGLATNAGARGILVRTGYGAGIEDEPPDTARPLAIVDTLLDAAREILRHPTDRGRSGRNN